jgi:ubiquinone/menaquinone biosynthesis C-methylase UbiE
MRDLDPIQETARHQFDKQSANYGKSHILQNTDDLRSTLNVLKPQRGQKLLDVATGGGHTGFYFARLGLDVTMADISAAMLERVQQTAKDENLTISANQHPAEELPYPDASFDLVTCRIAAHHFSCPASFVMEAARVLKKGGHFLLIDGTVEDGEPEAEEWMHQVEKLRDPSHNRLITPLKWAHLCGHAGLRVVHSEIQTMKQPDLEWYFNTAGTCAENRVAVRTLIATAPGSARRLFRLAEEDGKTIWWWQRLILVAVKL